MTQTFSSIATVQGRAKAEAVSNDLEALIPEPMGVGVFEVEDGSGLWEVSAYFTERPDIAALGVLEALHGIAPFVVSDIPEQDWVAKVKRDLPPVEAGRFFVYGSHDAWAVALRFWPWLLPRRSLPTSTPAILTPLRSTWPRRTSSPMDLPER